MSVEVEVEVEVEVTLRYRGHHTVVSMSEYGVGIEGNNVQRVAEKLSVLAEVDILERLFQSGEIDSI